MGKLSVVGIGPGGYEDMTIRADRVLTACEVVVGYHVYVDLHHDGTWFVTGIRTRSF